MTRFNDPTRLIEDKLRLEQVIKMLKAVDPESINEHKSGDPVGDRLATEGFYWGTIQQLKNYLRVVQGKAKKIYV
jgi:hypothetical protein